MLSEVPNQGRWYLRTCSSIRGRGFGCVIPLLAAYKFCWFGMPMPRIRRFSTRRLFLESLHLPLMRGIGWGQRRDHFRVTAWGRFRRIITVGNKLNRCSQSTAVQSQALETGWKVVGHAVGRRGGGKERSPLRSPPLLARSES